MPAAYESNIRPDGSCSSGEDLHPGLIYTPAYYEEEQLYTDLLESTDKLKQQTPTSCMNPTVEINETCTTSIDLPPILWHGYKTVPKILSLTNTGRTILINGQWVKGRPYIEGGPLNGTYIFSQIHFHSPSEHEIHGKRYPLEMHVVHYKTSYLTQERAMQERDGTVVLVYLFQVLDTTQTGFSSVTKLAPKIEKVNSRTETKDISLEQIVKPFRSNYYIYWGSVATGKHSYLLQWIVNAGIVYVTKKEADDLLGVMNFGELNVKTIPRMKPENNTIYYVEEMEEESKPEVNECSTCRSFEEWRLSHCSHQSREDEIGDEDSTNFRYCICKRDEDSRSQPVLSCKNTAPKNNFSGLRICCHKERKGKKNSQGVRITCSKGQVCVCAPPEKLDKCTINKIITNKETNSCPSVNTETQVPACTEMPACADDKDVKLKVACSCPSVKKCIMSISCEDETKGKGKKKKKSDAGKDVCAGTSSTQSNKKKEDKSKERRKSQKRESCEETCVEVCPSRKSSSAKREKKSPPKKTKKDSDADSTKSAKKSKKGSKTCQEECVPAECVPAECEPAECAPVECAPTDCVPVECVKAPLITPFCQEMTTVPEKSFEEILREYDTTWLEDSKMKITKTESEDICQTSRNIMPTKNPPPSVPDDNAITTIFEKKREPKITEPPSDDCTISFLLKPNSRKSNPSSSFMSPKSISEELKCVENKVSNKGVNVPDVTVNTVTLSGVRIPTENPNELPKEFCVQVELLFHANNKDFSECVTQEYNLALMYNQNILQEYRGTLCPNNLQIGNYEKLELVPKYPELDNISIRLQDCTVKMESSDQLCMRAKFLMKELNFKNLDAIGEQEGEENTDKKMVVVSDAVTQYSVKEFDKPKEFDILEKISLQAKVSQVPQKPVLVEEPEKTSSRVTFSTPRSQLSNQSIGQTFENQNCEVRAALSKGPGEIAVIEAEEDNEKPDGLEEDGENSNCSEELSKNSNCSNELSKDSNGSDEGCMNPDCSDEVYKTTEYTGEGYKHSNSSEEVDETKKDNIGKEMTKKAVKELKNIFSNRKKTVYFMYEKIEKDENSGKKVFVGSFRSRDDVKGMAKGKKSVHGADNLEEKKLLLLSAKDSTAFSDFPSTLSSHEGGSKCQSLSPSKNVINDKKDLVTLHKFKPKHLKVNDSKRERLNLVVGKALNQLQKDSRNFKRLADLVGLDQKENSKISVYELQESTETDSPESSLAPESAENRTSRYPSVMLVSEKVSQGSLGKKSSETEGVESRKSVSKKGSQSAVIIIPVEVESLSKVEVILVEHSDNPKKTILKRGKEIVPCLNY